MELRTERLTLRFPMPRDREPITQLARDRRVTRMMFLPWPYETKHADLFLRLARAERKTERGYHFVIERRADDTVLGALGVQGISVPHLRGEVGYWIGARHWGKGYATEALRRLVQFSFRDLDLQRVHAMTLSGNPGSDRVLEKTGFQFEGTQRRHIKNKGRWRDARLWGLLRTDDGWQAGSGS